jgi:hypothetical protein
MPAGRVFAMAPDMPHHERRRNTHSSYTAIMMARSLWDSIAVNQDKTPEIDCRDAAMPAILPALLADFMTEASLAGGGSPLMLDALARIIALHILRAFDGAAVSAPLTARREEIRRVTDYIAQNSGIELHLDTLALISGWSLSHFSRMFRRETGCSPLNTFCASGSKKPGVCCWGVRQP